jgi:molecular chaperone HscB
VNLTDNDFVIFGLPERFELERAELDARWRALQSSVHPDKFAADGSAAQRVAMQWATRVNEAYRRLREPLSRAAYLCELRGVPIDAERNTAMPPDFLIQQMSWREALEEAAEDAPTLAALDTEVGRTEDDWFGEVGRSLDQRGDAAAAADRVRALMFVRKFRRDLADRLARLEAI